MAIKKKVSKGATGSSAVPIQAVKEVNNGRTRQNARTHKRIQESYPMIGGVGSGEDFGWRSISDSSGTQRDLNSMTQERMRDIAFYLFDSNPIAHRLINITSNFVVGDGFSYIAEDERIKEIIDEFWEHNNIDEEIENDINELSIFGELCTPVGVNKFSGLVTLGYLDPSLIKGVIKDRKNPRISKTLKYAKGKNKNDLNTYTLINQHPVSGRLEGNAFYFTINKVRSSTRGRSDLLPLCDWLDGHDQFLFARLERAFLMNNFIWDITVDGATEEELKKFVRTIGGLKPGSVRAHNDKITWKAVNPKLEANDGSQESRLFKNQILGGAGYPEHWFAEGSNTTRATAMEMGLPTLKHLRARQKKIKFMIELQVRFAIDQAVAKRPTDFPEGEDKVNKKFKIVPSPIISRDTKGTAEAVKNFGEGLALAQVNKWITSEEAKNAFKVLLTQVGTEFSIESIKSDNDEDEDQDEIVTKVEPREKKKENSDDEEE